MELESLTPNSNKYRSVSVKAKEEKQETDIPVIKPVANGKRKKKGFAKRFAELFFTEDVGDVKEYLIKDVIIPTITDGIVNTLESGIEGIFYGRTTPRNRKPGTGGYVSYNNYSSKPVPKRSERNYKNSYDIDDVIFDTRAEAEQVLDVMEEAIGKYKSVSVAQFFDAANVTANNPTNNDWGWTDISAAKIQRDREGFVIHMPRCIELD